MKYTNRIFYGIVFTFVFNLVLAALPPVNIDALKKQYNVSDAEIKSAAETYLNSNPAQTVQNNKPILNDNGVISEKAVEIPKAAEIKQEPEFRSIIESKFPKELKQFGYDVFNQVSLTFTPLENIPVGGDYILGAGDELIVYLWGNIQQNFNLIIDTDGTVILPKAGKVNVANLTLSDAKRIINNLMEKYFANFTMDITLGKLKTIDVFILGEVKTPGRYNLNSLSTFLYGLYASGGPTKIGTLRNIQLIRDRRLYKTIDLYDLLIYGDKSDDIQLKKGDTIYVPKIADTAAIKGEIKVPAIYELKENTTMYSLLAMSGKYTRSTYFREVNLIRRGTDSDQFRLQTLTFKSYDDFINNSKKIPIENGDIIDIKAISDQIDNWVDIEGDVLHPGLYEYGKVQNLQALLTLAGGFNKTAYLDRVEIYRMTTSNMDEILPINAKETDLKNISLEMFDKIKVYSTSELNKNYNLSIQGEVSKPGNFVYYQNMTLEDLVFKAGDFKYNADKEKIYVMRKMTTSNNKIIEVKNNEIKTFVLQPLDEVFIKSVRDFDVAGTVEIRGETMQPGIYPIYKNETLSMFIKRIGGFTDEAYIPGIEFYRVNNNLNLLQSINKTSSSNEILVQNIMSLSNFNRIRMDAGALFYKNVMDEDLKLQDKDSIVVPPIPQTVGVVGGVYNQGMFVYKENRNMQYYLNDAGLFRKDADTPEIFVIHADGTVSKTNDFGTGVQKGDIIVVPTKEIKDFDLVKTILDWTQIIFNIAVTWKVVF
ncbi:MAG: SLBB domain-containing protein [Candidatus Margulisbacteria bacterium]|nr:SLBB domain-containing protein [Candidatus Margulisiibacteriota bacterium]